MAGPFALAFVRRLSARHFCVHRCINVAPIIPPRICVQRQSHGSTVAGPPLIGPKLWTKSFSASTSLTQSTSAPLKSALMLSTLRIVFPPSSDNQTLLPFVTLLVDGQRYLFNVPEGSTRIGLQRGARIAKTEHVFVNSVGTENAGLAGEQLFQRGCHACFRKPPHSHRFAYSRTSPQQV